MKSLSHGTADEIARCKRVFQGMRVCFLAKISPGVPDGDPEVSGASISARQESNLAAEEDLQELNARKKQ